MGRDDAEKLPGTPLDLITCSVRRFGARGELARVFEEARAKRRQCFARTFAAGGQPPPPCCGALAATDPTIRSKSAFPPGLPWIGTCCATSSFSRLMFWNSATAFGLTFAGGAAPCAGGV